MKKLLAIVLAAVMALSMMSFASAEGLAGEYDIEVYLPPEEGSDDMKVYIWVPLKQA